MCARSFTEWWRLKMEISRISRWLLKSYAMAGSQYFWGPKTKQMQFFCAMKSKTFFPELHQSCASFHIFWGGTLDLDLFFLILLASFEWLNLHCSNQGFGKIWDKKLPFLISLQKICQHLGPEFFSDCHVFSPGGQTKVIWQIDDKHKNRCFTLVKLML